MSTMKQKTAAKAAPRPRRKVGHMSLSQAVHLAVWALIIALLFKFLDTVSAILLPFVVGGVLAYLFDPLADRMERHHVPRALATALITVVFFALLIGLLVWLGPILYHQLSQLIARVPQLARELEILVRDQGQPALDALNHLTNGKSDSLPKNASDIIERAFEMGGNILLGVLASGGALLNVISLLLITPIVSFYLLKDWDKGIAKLGALMPRAYAGTLRELAHQVNHTLAAYLRGQLYVMAILTVFYVILLSMVGLKFALVIGVLAGCLVIVPYLGTLISTTLGLLIAYSQYDFDGVFWVVVVIFTLGQVLESQILTPKVIGTQVGLHPIWMLFAMLSGGALAGFIGVLLAIPAAAVISVLVKFLLDLYLKSPLYTER
jgi:predicted PurR-regulated permease PerM